MARGSDPSGASPMYPVPQQRLRPTWGALNSGSAQCMQSALASDVDCPVVQSPSALRVHAVLPEGHEHRCRAWRAKRTEMLARFKHPWAGREAYEAMIRSQLQPHHVWTGHAEPPRTQAHKRGR